MRTQASRKENSSPKKRERMQINQLRLKDFRNYENLDISFHPKVNIFLGNNAQGKTNLLEALYITSLGKSFRTGRDWEMIRFEMPFFRVEVDATKDGDPLSIDMAVSQEKKGIKIDGLKASKTSELLEHLYTVIFSPEDLKIVKDEPEKRRRFIDREISQLKPSYYQNLSCYKKALVQRNALLKDCNLNEENLNVWDESLAYYGHKIIEQRELFISKLDIISWELHKEITEGKETLEVIYEKDCSENLLDVLGRSHRRDRMRGTTCVCPHRDDLKILVNGVDIRPYGSQGQQRTAALSLKLSELQLIKEETGEEGILLLDDVLSELDAQRQQFLIKSLGAVQLFITATELSAEVRNSLPGGNLYIVTEGSVIKDKENAI
jgi:DNA replication and repair protein RecF